MWHSRRLKTPKFVFKEILASRLLSFTIKIILFCDTEGLNAQAFFMNCVSLPTERISQLYFPLRLPVVAVTFQETLLLEESSV